METTPEPSARAALIWRLKRERCDVEEVEQSHRCRDCFVPAAALIKTVAFAADHEDGRHPSNQGRLHAAAKAFAASYPIDSLPIVLMRSWSRLMAGILTRANLTASSVRSSTVA